MIMRPEKPLTSGSFTRRVTLIEPAQPTRRKDMADVNLEIAFWDYDRTRALANGTVKIPDANERFHSAPIVTQIFEGVVRGQFNVSELGLTYFLRTFQDGDSPFIAIPI